MRIFGNYLPSSYLLLRDICSAILPILKVLLIYLFPNFWGLRVPWIFMAFVFQIRVLHKFSSSLCLSLSLSQHFFLQSRSYLTRPHFSIFFCFMSHASVPFLILPLSSSELRMKFQVSHGFVIFYLCHLVQMSLLSYKSELPGSFVYQGGNNNVSTCAEKVI